MGDDDCVGDSKGKEEDEEGWGFVGVLELFFLAEAGERGGDLVERGDSVGVMDGVVFLSEAETLLLINLLMSLSTKLSELLVGLLAGFGLSELLLASFL